MSQNAGCEETTPELSPMKHEERHFMASNMVRDIVIGMSDGLTVPFALAAGLTGVGASTAIVVTGGLAEIAAGSIAMGLGGYLAARSDQEHYQVERRREQREVKEIPSAEKAEVADILSNYGIPKAATHGVLKAFQENPNQWIDFMMRFELGLEKPEPKRAVQSAATIALAYIFGGLIPLLPYILLQKINLAFDVSIMGTLAALLIFGFIKGRVMGVPGLRSALQTGLVGGLATTAAYVLARLLG